MNAYRSEGKAYCVYLSVRGFCGCRGYIKIGNIVNFIPSSVSYCSLSFRIKKKSAHLKEKNNFM